MQASHVVLFWVVLVVFLMKCFFRFRIDLEYQAKAPGLTNKMGAWYSGDSPRDSGRLSKLTKTFHGNYH